MLFGNHQVCAQTNPPNYFQDTSLFFAEHLRNLNGLANEMAGISVLTDRLTVDNLIYDFNQLNYDVTNLYQLNLIQASMTSQKDKKVIDDFFGIAIKRLKKDCDFAATDINPLIASLQQPGALNESKLLRDKVAKLCDGVNDAK
jgi:hypothetical protein